MLSVLYIINSLRTGGAEKSLTEIALHNSLNRSSFIVLTEETDLTRELMNKGVTVHCLNRKDKMGFKDTVQQILPLIRAIKPDIIHSTFLRSDLVARKLRKILDVPVVNSFVSNSYSEDRYSHLSPLSRLKLKYFEWLDKRTASGVDCFISNSETIKVSNSKWLKVSPDKVRVIHRGRNAKKILSVTEADKEMLRKELGLSHEKVVLNVGRLIPSKAQDELIRAFAKIINKHPDSVLLIAGRGRFLPQLESLITELGVGRNVRLLGRRDDVPALLGIAHVFAFPTYVEGLPGSLIEAMMARKVIICSDIEENQECVSPDEAIIIKKGDVDSMARNLDGVLSDLAKYEKMAERAQARALEHFEIGKIVTQYNRAYAEILASFRGKGR